MHCLCLELLSVLAERPEHSAQILSFSGVHDPQGLLPSLLSRFIENFTVKEREGDAVNLAEQYLDNFSQLISSLLVHVSQDKHLDKCSSLCCVATMFNEFGLVTLRGLSFLFCFVLFMLCMHKSH